jgi:hypothetical protein
MCKKNIPFIMFISSMLIYVFLLSGTVFSQNKYNDRSYSTDSDADATGVGFSSAVAGFPQEPVVRNYAKTDQRKSFSAGSFADEWYYRHEGSEHDAGLAYNSIGLTGSGRFYAGITLDLSGEINNQITQVAYCDYSDGTGSGLSGTVKVYRGSLGSSSPTLISNATTTFTTGDNGQFRDITLANPVTISGSGQYSIVIEIQQTAAQYVIAVDNGPMAPNGGYLSLDGRFPFDNLENNGFDYDWLIEAYVANVGTPARITTEPQDDSAQIGGSADFTVTASGSTPISYQWEKLSGSTWSSISGATSRQLTINPVAQSDTGSYRVRVWNTYGGETSETVQLYVSNPTVITTHPVSKAVAVGETATFTVAATGSALTYQWQVMAPGGSWHDSLGATTTSLTTVPATLDMNGTQYRCVVSGSTGSPVPSNSATLTVGQSIKPLIVTNLDSVYKIPAGDTAALQVSVIGLSPLSYQWEKFIASAWTPLTGNTTDTYTINGMNSTFEGLYRVRVWNDSGSVTSNTARVVLIGTVPNIIKIDTSWFDEVTNYVVVNWHIDTSQVPPQCVFKSAYAYNRGTVMNTDSTFYGIDTVKNSTNTTFINIADLYWDTTYTIGFWLGYETKSGTSNWTRPTDSSTFRLDIPSFTWQIVTFFNDAGANGEVVEAANGKITLREINNFLGPETDTLRAYHPNASLLPEGLVLIDAISFKFCRNNYVIPDFMLELSYKSLPPGISESDVGLYRDVNGDIMVVHGFSVDGLNKVVKAPVGIDDLTGHPFIVLADTTTPVIAIGPHSEQVDIVDSNVTTNFKIMDNISNVQCQFLYGRGDRGYEYSDNAILTEDTADYVGLIYSSAGVLSPLYGTRAILIVSDGVNSAIVNVSRSVKTSSIEPFSIPKMKWAPLRVAAKLLDPSLESCFNRSSGQQWVYDKTKIRLFRYYNPDSSSTAPNFYVEYSDGDKSHFEFDAGRLIWCKAGEAQTLRFGEGYTTSLRTPYEFYLKAGSWTDFCLPFQFSIKLKDVLDATGMGSDSLLDFYRWVDDDSTSYVAIKMRLGLIDLRKPVEDTLISQQSDDGYTVKNNSLNDIMLKIPPISLPLSPECRPKRRDKTDDMWDISFLWKEKDKHNIYREVVCAYNRNIGNKTVFGSLPPSMDRKVRIGILDSVNNSLHGYAISNSAENGGMYFKVAFHNTSEAATRIEYRLDNLEALPEGYHAKVLNPSTRLYESTDDNPVTEIDLLPGTGSVTERLVVVGTEGYLDDVLQWITPATFAFLKAYPNPFNGTIKLHYTLPPDISELNITLYDVLGRTIWKTIKRKGIHAGTHIFTFNGSAQLDNGNGILPAGVYILRLSAKNKSGKLIFGGEKRITCIR